MDDNFIKSLLCNNNFVIDTKSELFPLTNKTNCTNLTINKLHLAKEKLKPIISEVTCDNSIPFTRHKNKKYVLTTEQYEDTLWASQILQEHRNCNNYNYFQTFIVNTAYVAFGTEIDSSRKYVIHGTDMSHLVNLYQEIGYVLDNMTKADSYGVEVTPNLSKQSSTSNYVDLYEKYVSQHKDNVIDGNNPDVNKRLSHSEDSTSEITGLYANLTPQKKEPDNNDEQERRLSTRRETLTNRNDPDPPADNNDQVPSGRFRSSSKRQSADNQADVFQQGSAEESSILSDPLIPPIRMGQPPLIIRVPKYFKPQKKDASLCCPCKAEEQVEELVDKDVQPTTPSTSNEELAENLQGEGLTTRYTKLRYPSKPDSDKRNSRKNTTASQYNEDEKEVERLRSNSRRGTVPNQNPEDLRGRSRLGVGQEVADDAEEQVQSDRLRSNSRRGTVASQYDQERDRSRSRAGQEVPDDAEEPVPPDRLRSNSRRGTVASQYNQERERSRSRTEQEVTDDAEELVPTDRLRTNSRRRTVASQYDQERERSRSRTGQDLVDDAEEQIPVGRISTVINQNDRDFRDRSQSRQEVTDDAEEQVPSDRLRSNSRRGTVSSQYDQDNRERSRSRMGQELTDNAEERGLDERSGSGQGSVNNKPNEESASNANVECPTEIESNNAKPGTDGVNLNVHNQKLLIKTKTKSPDGLKNCTICITIKCNSCGKNSEIQADNLAKCVCGGEQNQSINVLVQKCSHSDIKLLCTSCKNSEMSCKNGVKKKMDVVLDTERLDKSPIQLDGVEEPRVERTSITKELATYMKFRKYRQR